MPLGDDNNGFDPVIISTSQPSLAESLDFAMEESIPLQSPNFVSPQDYSALANGLELVLVASEVMSK